MNNRFIYSCKCIKSCLQESQEGKKNEAKLGKNALEMKKKTLSGVIKKINNNSFDQKSAILITEHIHFPFINQCNRKCFHRINIKIYYILVYKCHPFEQAAPCMRKSGPFSHFYIQQMNQMWSVGTKGFCTVSCSSSPPRRTTFDR